MKLLHSEHLADDLSSKYLILDSTSLINASQSDDFLTLLVEIKKAGCSFMTIPSVVHEFTRGAKTIEQLNKQLGMIEELKVAVMPRLEESIKGAERIFLQAYNIEASGGRTEKGPSYTDSLLCLLAYKYRTNSVLLMSANHKDIPASIFDRENFITLEASGTFRTEGIYKLSDSKFGKVLDRLK